MKRFWNFVAAVAVVAAFALLIRADGHARKNADSSPAITPVVGAGNWIADTGDVIQLRYDGTGRSRHHFGGTVQECNFDWSCDGNMLTVMNFPNVLGSFMAHETGLARATFTVETVTSEEFVFRHNGVIVTLIPGTGHEQPTKPANAKGNPGDRDRESTTKVRDTSADTWDGGSVAMLALNAIQTGVSWNPVTALRTHNHRSP
ncbi:MAG: hypothetical protein AAGD07_08205 [Planctomycetota bacterium]